MDARRARRRASTTARAGVACVVALALAAGARASVAFDPPSGTRATRTLRVAMRTTDGAATTIVYTLNGATPAIGEEDTKTYEGKVTLPCVREARRGEARRRRIGRARLSFWCSRRDERRRRRRGRRRIGTWTVKAAATKDGGVGEVTEAKYDVTTGGGENSSALTPGHVLGVALLLVMGLFGFVVFAGVCTAGFNALFKTAPPTIRGPGASDPRIPRTSSTSGMAEMGQVSSLGFRNTTNPAIGGGGGDDAGTTRLLQTSASSGDLTPMRAGKRD